MDTPRTVTPKPANNTCDDDVVKPRALKTFIDGLAELGIDKRLIQNKRILAELLDKEQAYRDKDSEAGDKEITVSESSDNEDDTETASEISEQEESENPDLEPEGNSEILLETIHILSNTIDNNRSISRHRQDTMMKATT